MCGDDEMDRRLGLRSKLWLECDGKPIIGDGRMKMLRAIDHNGSIKLAARETGISYRRMRGAIQEMEHAIGYPLVTIQRGGDGGGGARLTPAARDLMDTFEKIADGFQRKADARFRKMLAFLSPANGKICHSDRFFSSSNGKICHSDQNGDDDNENL